MRPVPIVIPTEKLPEIRARFERSYRVDPSGCWLWTKGLNKDGYGKFTLFYKTMTAHRLSWLLHFGSLPNLHPHLAHGTCVCHTCDRPACVNPAHLWLGSMGDNAKDRDAKGHCPGHSKSEAKRAATSANMRIALRVSIAMRLAKTHCKHGHPLSGDNLYLAPHRPNARGCLACRKAADRRRELRRQSQRHCTT